MQALLILERRGWVLRHVFWQNWPSHYGSLRRKSQSHLNASSSISAESQLIAVRVCEEGCSGRKAELHYQQLTP